MLIDAHCVLDLFKEMSPVMFVHKKKKKTEKSPNIGEKSPNIELSIRESMNFM